MYITLNPFVYAVFHVVAIDKNPRPNQTRKAFYMLILLSYLSSQLADELLLLGLVIVLIRLLNSLVYLMQVPLFKP